VDIDFTLPFTRCRYCRTLPALYSYSLLRLILVVVSTVATPGEWQCKIRTGSVRQLAVANGPNNFQMLFVSSSDIEFCPMTVTYGCDIGRRVKQRPPCTPNTQIRGRSFKHRCTHVYHCRRRRHQWQFHSLHPHAHHHHQTAHSSHSRTPYKSTRHPEQR